MNIVVDSSKMIPGGFHFQRPLTADGVKFLQEYKGDDSEPHLMKTRTEAGPMKYYFIDFGLSVRFPSFETRGLVTGEDGRMRKRVPEISQTVPYDPFKVDVRLVGEMLRREFLLVSLYSFPQRHPRLTRTPSSGTPVWTLLCHL